MAKIFLGKGRSFVIRDIPVPSEPLSIQVIASDADTTHQNDLNETPSVSLRRLNVCQNWSYEHLSRLTFPPDGAPGQSE